MNNLFVLHTQYNLLLAIGLCRTEFQEDANNLILFSDFKLLGRHKMVVEQTFKKVLYLQGNYPKVVFSSKQKYEKIRNDNRYIKSFVNDNYDRLFIVEDMCIQEMYCMKCVGKTNSSVNMFWLEDGANAYFRNSSVSLGMGATPLKRWIRRFCFSIRFGLGKYYELGPCMGSNRNLKSAWFTFPNSARAEFLDREHLLISDEAFKQGMEALFGGQPIEMDDNSVLIALDKLSVYDKYLPMVNLYVEEIVREAKDKNVVVYYKYHPREDENLPALADSIELDRTVALESYLINTTAASITIIGFKSTALQTAKKMGFESISYIKKLEPDNSVIANFYDAIGIICK